MTNRPVISAERKRMSKHRYRGRRSEFPGIVVRLWGEWHRITRPPYGIQLVRETR